MAGPLQFKDGTIVELVVDELGIVSLDIRSRAINTIGICEMFSISSSGLYEDFVWDVLIDGEKKVELYDRLLTTNIVHIHLHRISTGEKCEFQLG